jgi:hypothetical protein
MTRKKAPRAHGQFWALAAPAAGLSVLAAGGAGFAETSISTATTTAVATSTVKSGAADDISITADGTVKPASGTAVTLDSDNKVTNAGTIQFTGVNDATGVLIAGGHTGSLTNSGVIQVGETITTTDTDSDGDADGPFVTGSGRYGVRIVGPGAFTGDITTTTAGSIVAQGNDSIALSLETALNGSILHSGAIATVGDRSFGLRTTGSVSGDVSLLGGVNVQGKDAVAVYLGGDVGGRLVVQSSIVSTGYRSSSRSTTQSVLDALDADDLLQGGSAVVVAGNLAKGFLVDIPPTLSSTITDVDGDGITDTAEGTGVIATYGRAPAVVIGTTGRSVTLGNLGTGDDAYGMVNHGSIIGSGVYDGVDATGLLVGVASGGAVDLGGGLRNSGTISAGAYKADATAVHINGTATVPTLRNQGTISSSITGETGATSRGVLIEAGAKVTDIANAGSISAVIVGSSGKAIAIQDLSGSVTSVENLKTIGALISPSDTTLTNVGKAIAIDLSANTRGVTVHQTGVNDGDDGADGVADTDTDADGVDDADEPSITGQVLLGSGADLVKIDNGTVVGDISFGAGANALMIDGGATVKGKITADGGTIGLSIGAGALTMENPASLNLSSLSLASGSTLILSADPQAGTHSELDVAGTATIATGAKIGISLQSLLKGQATYTLIHATSLTSGAVDTSLLGDVPYLYNAALSTDATAGTVSIALARKTATQLALPASVAAAYEPLIKAIDTDTAVRDAFLAQSTRTGLIKAYNQMLPNHSGGMFEAVSAQADATARAIDDRQGAEAGGAWLQETSVVAEQDGTDDAPGYRASGFNISGGNEWGVGSLGVLGATLSLGSMEIRDDNASAAQNLSVNRAEAGGYWRFVAGRLVVNARLAGSYIAADSRRSIYIYDDSDALLVSRSAKGDWSGWAVNGRVAAAYEGRIGGLYARPTASLDYLRLEEGGYSEKNGGDAVDLHVSARQSSRSTGFAGLVTGARYGDQDGWWGPEMTLGYRAIGQAEIGSTTAQFQSGTDSFSLLADQIKGGGLVARVALKGETTGGAFAVEGGAETRDSLAIYDLRLAAHFRF